PSPGRVPAARVREPPGDAGHDRGRPPAVRQRARVAVALAALFACRPPNPAGPPSPPRPSYRWARQTLARMTLEERVAQMIGVRAFGLHYHPASEEGRRLRHEVRDLGVGSV